MEVIRLTSYVRRVISIFDPICLGIGKRGDADRLRLPTSLSRLVRPMMLATEPSCSKLVRGLPQVVANPPTGIGPASGGFVQREPAWGAFVWRQTKPGRHWPRRSGKLLSCVRSLDCITAAANTRRRIAQPRKARSKGLAGQLAERRCRNNRCTRRRRRTTLVGG